MKVLTRTGINPKGIDSSNTFDETPPEVSSLSLKKTKTSMIENNPQGVVLSKEVGNRTPPGEYPSDRDSLDEICKDFFTSSWPWEREAESHYDLVSFKSGTTDLPNYGDARGFKNDPRDLNPLY
jgi:hypothetical protein